MTITARHAALRYAKLGWPVLPLNGKAPLTPHAYKDGSTDRIQIERWWEKHPNAGIGIVVGPESGVCVLDVDPRDGGEDSLERLIEEHGPLPETPAVATGGGGTHYYFRYCETATRSTVALGLEIKARDGYVVAPPSLNRSTGKVYKWITPKGLALAELPPWLAGGRAHGAKATTSSELNGAAIPAGQRNSTLARLAGRLRQQGATEVALLGALLAENQARCQPPLPDAEVQSIAQSIARYAPKGQIEIAAWPDLPEPAAFHGIAGEFVHLIEPHTESDPVAVLVQFLLGFGSLVGRGPRFEVEADRHHTNEFAVLVGETSKGRKGTSFGIAMKNLGVIDPDWANQRQVGGLSSGEGLIWEARDLIMERSPIRQGGRVSGYQEIEADAGVTDKRLLVYEPEFASTLRVMGRDGSTLSGVVRQAWDSGNLRALTKKSPAKATGAHISIIGHVTRDELLRYLDRTEVANGFMNRFLMVCVRRSKILPEGGRIQEVDFQPLIKKLSFAVEWSRTRERLIRDDAARKLWAEVYELLSEGKPGMLGAVISRAEAHVVRLSLLYALLDRAPQIGRPHLEAALAFWRYAEASARYIFGDALGDTVADDLLAALREQPEGLTRTEISRHFGHHVTAEKLDRAFTALLERGLIRSERIPTPGREAERWFATHTAKEAKEVKDPFTPTPVSSLNSHSSQSAEATALEPTPPPSPSSPISRSPECVGQGANIEPAAPGELVALERFGWEQMDGVEFPADENDQASDDGRPLMVDSQPVAKEAKKANEAAEAEQGSLNVL